MVVNFPCKICCKPVAKNHESIQCDKCDTWVHRNCNKINKQTYKLLQKDKNSHWFCIICTKEFLPFSNLNNDEFIHTVKGKKLKFTHVTKKKLPTEVEFFQQINSNLDENLDKYYLPDDLKKFEKDTQNNLNFFHLNISSLPYHFPELETLLATSEIDFDIIGITESRLKSNKNHLTNITLPRYNIEHCSTDGTNGGALLYIKEDIIYKKRNDLKILKSKLLESIFIEIINPDAKNLIIGCIYRHPCMELGEFNNDFLTYLCEKLLREKNKDIVLMGDFNVDLLKYENNTYTADFLDKIYSTSLIPQITSPTRITPRSETLIDNIFTTDANEETLSDNIITNISDHLAQFLSFPVKKSPHKTKKEIYKQNYKNFDADLFLSDLRNIDWQQALEISKKKH